MLLLKGGAAYRDGRLRGLDVAVDGGRIAAVAPGISPEGCDVLDVSGMWVIPGFVDVHVHLREPGFSYKETIESGTRAAARGGYTAVCAMPNLAPPPDSAEHLGEQLRLIEKGAAVRVYPCAAITRGQKGGGELVDFEALAGRAVGFSDDGRGVQSEELMRAAMQRVAKLDGLIAAHAEDDGLAAGGVAHDGEFAAARGLRGIPSRAEWGQIERDLRLVRETGCRYHACHLSTKEGVALIRAAKAEGLPVTAETAPHYLLMDDSMLQNDGRFKMNPPIRSRADRKALLAGLLDGTIDLIATDHAPHSAEEKAKGFASLMGVVGLETAFGVLNAGLVAPGILSAEALLERMCDAPRRVFRLPGGLYEGGPADLAVIDPSCEYTIDPETFLSKGRATPFAGWRARGRAILTMVDGGVAWKA
ncbi:MAG: dihydroorotase [Clostridiales bacterium]|nr:dihydroorotase [Clostridiales bacterium]